MRMHLALPAALSFVAGTAPCRAQPAADNEHLAGRELVVEDLAPRRLGPRPPRTATGATLSASLAMRQRPQGGAWAGGLLLTVPTPLFVSSRKAKRTTDPAKLRAGEVAQTASLPTEPEGGRAAVARPATTSQLPVVRPADARRALAAARRHSRVKPADGRLDALASRARWSALLPRLRLRATRLLDESSSVSPTSYDPNRVTSRGGASLWLEARTTWELDRLLFASEEVAIERLRQALADDDRALRQRVLEQLFGWQRAVYRARDPLAEPGRCLEAWLDEQQLGAALDLQTGGWLSRWLRGRHPPLPPCIVADGETEPAEP